MKLRDGTMVAIRPIRQDDGPRLETAFGRLSAESRYRRFLAAKPNLSSSELRYLVDVDGVDHVALVATLDDDPERIVAVGRFVRVAEDSGAAEFAIVVGEPYQRQGLATALLARMSDAAADGGITKFRATTLVDNVPVHRLIDRLSAGRARHRSVGPVDEIEFDLASERPPAG